MKKIRQSSSSPRENENEVPGDFPEIDQISFYTFGIYLVLSVPLILSAARGLSYVFTTGVVGYRCYIPECETSTDTILHPSWLPNAVPYINGKPDACTRFTVQNSSGSCPTTVFTNETKSCDAWIYDPEEVTILNEWDLTCENNLWKLTLPGTMNSLGQFIGLLFSGYLSDKYGRRNLLVACTIMSSILGLTRSFSVHYAMFVTFEFLDSMAGSAVYSAAFVLGLEFLGPKKRLLATSGTCSMYVIYTCLMGFFAMWLRSWRILLRIFYIPGFLVIFMPCIVPESIRWLLNKGRTEEAEEVLRKIAASNKIAVSEKSITLIRNWRIENPDTDNSKNIQKISPVKEVFRNRTILIRLIVCAFCWLCNAFVYYGLSLGSAVIIPGNKYINFILVAVIEIPALFLSWVLAERLGRRLTLSLTYLLSGIFCIIEIFVPADLWHLPLIVFLGGKFCISIAYHLVYVMTSEMFPTSLRHSLLAVCSMVGRIGSMSAPQVPLLAYYIPSLPLLLFGIMAILAGLLSLSFPETLGIKLPDTVCEAGNINNVKKNAMSLPNVTTDMQETVNSELLS